MLYKVLLCPKAYRQQSTHTAGSMWGQSGPFSRLLRQAGHTVGQFCNPGTTGGINNYTLVMIAWHAHAYVGGQCQALDCHSAATVIVQKAH